MALNYCTFLFEENFQDFTAHTVSNLIPRIRISRLWRPRGEGFLLGNKLLHSGSLGEYALIHLEMCQQTPEDVYIYNKEVIESSQVPALFLRMCPRFAQDEGEVVACLVSQEQRGRSS